MKKPCSVERCDKPSRRWTFCGTHSIRFFKYGDPNYSYKSPEQIEARFWMDVDKSAGHGPWGDCWLWVGRLDKDGYGECKSVCNKRTWKAHRFSYHLANGGIPEGLMVRHRCDVRNCINPKHLKLGTVVDNSADMKARNRSLRGERNPTAKLNDEKVIEIRRRAASGEKKIRLAEEFGVTDVAISDICNGKVWTHVQA